VPVTYICTMFYIFFLRFNFKSQFSDVFSCITRETENVNEISFTENSALLLLTKIQKDGTLKLMRSAYFSLVE